MLKQVLLYGLVCGALIAGLKYIQYRWMVVEHAVEIYAALVAAVFAGLGLWLGQRLVRRTHTVEKVEVVREVPVAMPIAMPVTSADPARGFVRDEARLADLGLTPRELEILELMAEGLSNKEIAARAHVSENTVKTHSSRVFDKLGARRRTQAVQQARQWRLIA